MTGESICPYCNSPVALSALKCQYCGKSLKYNVSESILNAQIKVYSTAIERNPDNPDLYLKRAHAFCALNKKELALNDAKKALFLYQKEYNTSGINSTVIIIESITNSKCSLNNKKSE